MTGKGTNGDARKDNKGKFIKDLRNGDPVEGTFVVRRQVLLHGGGGQVG